MSEQENENTQTAKLTASDFGAWILVTILASGLGFLPAFILNKAIPAFVLSDEKLEKLKTEKNIEQHMSWRVEYTDQDGRPLSQEFNARPKADSDDPTVFTLRNDFREDIQVPLKDVVIYPR